MHWEDRFRHVAATQAGVVGIDQMPSLGCSGDQWGRAKRSPRWASPSRRVLQLLGTTPSDEQRVHAALLDAGGGAVLYGESTLSWIGLRGFDLRQIHVVRRRETTRAYPRLGVLHRLRDLTEDDIIVIRGVPTVTPIRAIWSEASRYSSPRLFERGVQRVGRLLDNAHRAGLVTWAELHHSIERLARRGRAGTRIMRALADARPPGSSPTESRNEDRFEEILRSARRRTFDRQVHIGGSRPIGRVDQRDPELPVIIEVNSLTFHSTPSDRAADEARYAGAVAAGFTVAVVWESDLWSYPSGVVRTVDTVRRLARDGPPTVVHSPGCPWPHDPARRVVERRRPTARG